MAAGRHLAAILYLIKPEKIAPFDTPTPKTSPYRVASYDTRPGRCGFIRAQTGQDRKWTNKMWEVKKCKTKNGGRTFYLLTYFTYYAGGRIKLMAHWINC